MQAIEKEKREETPVKKSWLDRCLNEVLLYLALFFLTLLLFWVVKPRIQTLRKGTVAQAFIALSLLAILVFAAYMGMTKRLTTGRILRLLLAAGYVLRVGYMLYTPAATRQHDTFSTNFNGHEAYAWTIFDTGALPTHNDYQFYHPPLNALLQSGFMGFMQGLTSAISSLFGLEGYFPEAFSYAKPDYISAERYYLFSTCQILSVLYSFITAAVLVKILWQFAFSDRTKIWLSAFVILFPRQIQLAGQLNNDALSYLFAVLAIYFALRWQKGSKHPARIAFCGLFVGLGMMTKLTTATVCLPIAGIFIYEFVRTLRKKEGALSLPKMVGQYALFLVVCAPIGLWFQVYASRRFDQGFGFVFSNLNHELYTGDQSFFSRFFVAFDPSEYFGSLYCRPFENYNLFHYQIRSAIFGEFSYWQGEGFAVAAVLTAYLTAALLATSLVWAIVACVRTRKQENGVYKRAGLRASDLIFLFLLVQSQVLSHIYFYIQMPYGCTMDFRYILPMICAVALLLGYTRKTLCAEGGRFSVLLNRCTLLSSTAFILSSTLFYCVCI